MADANVFAKLVPGFDFLQGLMKNANAALPGMSQWVAPTLNPEEIDKRIEELRTVQFWLEQNARLLGATIQALEVQRMTLSTLRTMNVSMGDLAEAMKVHVPTAAPAAEPPAPTPSWASAARTPATPAADPEPDAAEEERADTGISGAAAAGGADAAPGVVDPMQWWGALTRQFTVLASQAMKEGSAEAARAVSAGATKSAPAQARKKPAATSGSAARAGAKTSKSRSSGTPRRATAVRRSGG